MTRGLFSGLLWGAVLSLGAAMALSTIVPLRVAQPQVAAADAPVILAPEPVDTMDAPTVAQDDKIVTTGASGLPDPTLLQLPALADEDPTAPPQTGRAMTLANPTSASAAQVRLAVKPDTVVLPSPLALAPMPPPQADALAVNTAPPARPESAAPPKPADLEIAPTPQTALIAGPARPVETSPATQTPQAAAMPQGHDTSIHAESAVENPQTEAQKATTTRRNPPNEETSVETTPEVPATAVPARQTDDWSIKDTQAPDAPLSDSATGVRVNRLGQSNSANATAADATQAAPLDAPNALTLYRHNFENVDKKPLMSIVLIDDGADLRAPDRGLAVLRQFPYPISIAIDANLTDANARMDAYRSEGFEVLAMVNLPTGARPSDAEVSLAVALEKLPETVAVLDGVNGGLQPSRETADHVTSILAQSGHGLVAQAQGLNTMPKLANKAGVPAAPVFRDFDGKGQSATVIRRFLDQAAFKAAQEGGVIMLGRIRPETINALLVWGLADRAGRVSLAPVSAVLTSQ